MYEYIYLYSAGAYILRTYFPVYIVFLCVERRCIEKKTDTQLARTLDDIHSSQIALTHALECVIRTHQTIHYTEEKNNNMARRMAHT